MGTCFSFLPPAGFICQKAETAGNGNGIVKLNQSLRKQVSRPACHSMDGEMELHHVGVPGHYLATQGRSSALWVMKAHLPSRPKRNCRRTGGVFTCEPLPVNAQVHGDGTNLTLPLPNPFHQNTLATRVDGSTSNQQPWELVSFSTGWTLACSWEERAM